MTIDLHLTAETPEELKKALTGLANSLDIPKEPINPLPAPKRNKGKKAEETTEAPDNEGYAFPQSVPAAPDPAPREEPPVAAVEPPAPSMEEARAALNALRQAKGNAAVRAILTAHNVSSFTDLPASEYAAVMEEAKA